MKKLLFPSLWVFFLASCQDLPAPDQSPSVALDSPENGQYVVSPKFTSFELALKDEDTGVILAGTLTLSLACDNVFGTGTSSDWTMTSVSATSTVSLIQNKVCRITITQYNDGTNTYTPVSSPLVISVASNGGVTTTSAVQYTTGGGSPILQWFAATQGGSLYTILVSFTGEAVTGNNTTTTTNLSSQAVPLTISGITAPTVSSLFVYNIPAMNSASASYTLVASVSSYTSCKYIDNSSSTYTPTSWSSVNTAYNAGGAQTCPEFVPSNVGFSVGNWTSLWGTGIKTLIIWANTVNGLNSYTTANIGP